MWKSIAIFLGGTLTLVSGWAVAALVNHGSLTELDMWVLAGIIGNSITQWFNSNVSYAAAKDATDKAAKDALTKQP
jgi:hypothetical protein